MLHAHAQKIGHEHTLHAETCNRRLAGLTRLEQIGDEDSVESIRDRVEIVEDRQADEFRLFRIFLDDARDPDAALHRTKRGDLRKIGLSD